MSNAITALNGASFQGLVLVQERPLTGMITVRADLVDAKVIKALKSVTGLAMPDALGIVEQGVWGLGWMASDEAIVFCEYASAQDTVAALTQALAGQHALVLNVSDARAFFELDGAQVRDVLAKLTPIDLRADAFTPGTLRRTKLAQAAAAVWLTDAGTARIVCFRSVAEYMMSLLSVAADADAAVHWHG